MKKIYLLLLAFSLFTTVNAQIINFPDANFKAKLLEHPGLDVNSDGEIDQNEAANFNNFIDVSRSDIQNLSGIEYFTNVRRLYCSSNRLTSIDVSNLLQLEEIQLDFNSITEFFVSNLPRLKQIDCSANPLTSISVSDLPELEGLNSMNNLVLTSLSVVNCTKLLSIDCLNNSITNLNLANLPLLNFLNIYDNDLVIIDVSHLPSLHTLVCYGSPFLRSLFIKNGIRQNIPLSTCPNLSYVCADESEIGDLINASLPQNCVINSYCSFTPGGTYYTIQGSTKFDLNGNGCDITDAAYSNLRFNITDGTTNGIFISNASGNYSIPVQAGNHTITPVLENPSYFNVSPSSVTPNFPSQASPLSQNFCLTANGIHPDLEVSVLPLTIARPGFDTEYKLIYKNKGNTTQSGTVNLTFNDAVSDFVSASPYPVIQTLNNLSWNFSSLRPFETQEITFTVNVNSPMDSPSVNQGDVLTYTATISSVATDETPNDNAFTLNQTVVNSYDPNDKTCLEGKTITPARVGDYVHYMIRFENTGTANAQNIVVKDMIDTNKFDISSLVPMKGSHSFVTSITSGNKVEFIFENINLPFDDANNDGYVMFKIKTKPTLVNGDTFSNSASIYFDYNFPIVTNTETTTIQALSNQDFEFANYFKLYPNPVHDVLNIATKETIAISSVNIYNALGQLVVVIPNAKDTKTIDVANLSSGNYFIKINSDKGTSNTKFIKQ